MIYKVKNTTIKHDEKFYKEGDFIELKNANGLENFLEEVKPQKEDKTQKKGRVE